MSPVAGSTASPSGNIPPVRAQWYGGTPPSADIAIWESAPKTRLGRVAVVIVRLLVIVTENCFVSVEPRASRTKAAKVYDPGVPGVPLRTPVCGDKVTPVGGDPEAMDQE